MAMSIYRIYVCPDCGKVSETWKDIGEAVVVEITVNANSPEKKVSYDKFIFDCSECPNCESRWRTLKSKDVLVEMAVVDEKAMFKVSPELIRYIEDEDDIAIKDVFGLLKTVAEHFDIDIRGFKEVYVNDRLFISTLKGWLNG